MLFMLYISRYSTKKVKLKKKKNDKKDYLKHFPFPFPSKM